MYEIPTYCPMNNLQELSNYEQIEHRSPFEYGKLHCFTLLYTLVKHKILNDNVDHIEVERLVISEFATICDLGWFKTFSILFNAPKQFKLCQHDYITEHSHCDSFKFFQILLCVIPVDGLDQVWTVDHNRVNSIIGVFQHVVNPTCVPNNSPRIIE
jgi:hypothetical protein